MDTVPITFCESVLTILSKKTLSVVRFISAHLWKAAAHEVFESMKEFSIFIQVDKSIPQRPGYDVVEGSTRLSMAELKNVKYPRCLYLSIDPWSSPRHPVAKEAFQALASLKHIDKMEIRQAFYFDSGVKNFWPHYVRELEVYQCKFSADSAFPRFLRRIIRTNCLKSLLVCSNSIEAGVEDLEDDLYSCIVHDGRVSDVAMCHNSNLTNLSIDFLERLIKFWIISKKGFMRQVNFYLPSNERKGKKTKELRDLYMSGITRLRHESGCSELLWTEDMFWVRFALVA